MFYWSGEAQENVVTVSEIENAPEVDPIHAADACYCHECENWHAETAWCKEHSYFVDAEGNPCTPAENGEWKTFPPYYFCADGRRRESAE